MKQTHTLTQGTPEWHSFRATHFGASEAAVMLGLSPYKSRDQLLREKATGIEPEHTEQALRLFSQGHELEKAARSLAESEMGEDLYPVTLSADIEGLPLSASLDGITLMEDQVWEHKMLNRSLHESLPLGEIPDYYVWQLEQQLLVSGAETAILWASDAKGTHVNAEYTSRPDVRSTLIEGWKRFQADLANWQPETPPVTVTGTAPETLPALRIDVTGMVTASNLDAFKSAALAVFDSINLNPSSDTEFADAEKTVKWCAEVESRIDATKQAILAQTETIDAVYRVMDDLKAKAREHRLALEKSVKARKEALRTEAVMHATTALQRHVQGLAHASLVTVKADFAGVIKGLKTLSSIRDKLAAELASVTAEATRQDQHISSNRELLDDPSLMPDFAQHCLKDPEHFQAILNTRKLERQTRLEEERERIRQQEEAKARAEAEAKLEAERQRIRQEEAARAQAEAEQARLDAEEIAKRQRQAVAQRIIEEAAAETQAEPEPKPEPQPVDPDMQAVVRAFLSTRDFGKDNSRIRAILIEYEKHRATWNTRAKAA